MAQPTAGTGTGPNMAAHSSLTEHLVVVLNTILGRVNREGDLLENGLLLYPEMPHRAQVVAPRDPAQGPPARIRNLRGYRGEMPAAGSLREPLARGGARRLLECRRERERDRREVRRFAANRTGEFGRVTDQLQVLYPGQQMPLRNAPVSACHTGEPCV